MLKILLNLLLTVSSNQCPSICSSTPCALPCLNSLCSPSFSNCDRLINCPESCLTLIGNSNCDPQCNLPECGWDGLDCGETCNKDCRILHDISNGICDTKCFSKSCDWDGSDCTKRKTESCDCSEVSPEAPYQYTIGQENSFKTLTEFFSADPCCKNVQVNLESDTSAELAEGNKYYLKEDIETLKIVGSARVKVEFAGSGRLFLYGVKMTWENVEVSFGNRQGKDFASVVVEDDGEIVVSNCVMTGNLYPFVSVKQGKMGISGLEVSGKVVGGYVFSSEECYEDCEVEISSLSVKNVDMQSGGFLIAKDTNVSITGIQARNIVSSGNFVELSRSVAEISEVHFESSSFSSIFQASYLQSLTISAHTYSKVQVSSSIFHIKYSESCQFSDLSISDSSSSPTSSLFTLSGTTSSFTNTIISSAFSPLFDISKDSSTSISNLSLTSIFPQALPILSNTNSYITISSSSFSNTNSTAVQLSDSIHYSSSILDSVFENCSSAKGAAIYNSNSNLQIHSSVFQNNSASISGGAIYSDNQGAELTIKNSQFKENHSVNGGAIFIHAGTLNEEQNVFEMNSAVNGNNLAGAVFRVKAEKDFESSRPGQITNGCLIYTLLDYYNQTVYLADDSLMIIMIDNQEVNNSIHGQQISSSNKGVYKFCNLTFYGRPDSVLTIKSQLSCNEHYCKSSNEEFIEVYLEPCRNGEVQTESLNNCVECTDGSYSLTGNNTVCTACPDNAKCYSDQILPLKGYWHLSSDPASIFKCVNPDSCEENGTCSKGYTGNLCAVCDKGYTSSTSNTCKKCPSRVSNIVLLTFITLILTAILCYVIYRTYEDAFEPKLYHSVLIKILLNYFQLMMLTSVLKMRWPQPFYDFISIQEQIGSSTAKLLSIDCLIQDSDLIEPFYANQLFSFLAPLVLGLLITIIWTVIALIIKDFKRCAKPYITSLVVVFFVLHPGVSNNALSIFSCHEIKNGEYWNTNSFDIQCYTSDYAEKYYAIFILTLIFWTIGMPFVAYLMLRKNMKNLEEPFTKAKYGFLYQGYNSSRFYWEFVIMLRKILIISVTLLLRMSTVSLQLIFVLLILTGALILNLYYKPFELYELNRTENFSIILSIICFASGLMIESEASFIFHVILFIVLIVSNFLFFCYFAKRVYQAIGHYLWNNFPHIARNICPNAQRPKIKIREILQKEERRNRKKQLNCEPQSGFVDNNKEVIVQLWNMRHFADFYNEVLAARFSGNNIEETEKREQELVDNENNLHGLDGLQTVNESRPFFKRIFSRKKKMQTVQQKILNIRKQTLVENMGRVFSVDFNDG